MRRLWIALFWLLEALTLHAQPLVYPPARRDAVVDVYHGMQVSDPYRWLENPESPETQAWIEAQNRLTFSWLAQIPERERIRKRLLALWNYPKYGLPRQYGGRYFYTLQEGLQNQPVLYWLGSARDSGRGRVALDPNALSADGTVALTSWVPSPDGRLLAYGTSTGGSDWQVIRVRDLERDQDLPDVIRWVKFNAPAWTPDGRGFFYARYPEPTGAALREPNRHMKLYYHRLGTPQEADQLIYERPDDPGLGFSCRLTEDGRYAIITIWKGTDRRNRIAYIDLQDTSWRVVPLLDAADASYEFVGNTGSVFYFLTDRDAPKGRLIAVHLARPQPEHWETIIPESEAVLQDAVLLNYHFVVHELVHVSSRLALYNIEGRREREIPLPTLGSVTGLSARMDDTELFFGFTSFLYPTTIYRFDYTTKGLEVFRAPRLPIDLGAYETRQVFYPSKDGTRVPMFLVHRRDLKRDGSNPVYLYGYGGFNISLTPSFSVANLIWLELGGVYAVPNLRGGGEYGEAWHRAGMRERKQNVFDDFIAAAEYLIREGYTQPKRIAIAGASNGGLLVGAVMTQRPELFGAALPAVGVLDMLRYHKFTIGWAWIPEYGSADDPEQFRYLIRYSPYHNVRPGTCYPPTLITTADHDDRVVPAHSYKFAAALQAAQACDKPILIRVETRAGHGAGKPASKQIEELADRFAFLVRVLELRWPS
ncbi:MAG: prolyl oligopeptidase family serine peptidase [Bacteroidetes bacterium]|nr:prolyl oligopeptidase family serine peptidase [Bacteroidota bacterium]